MLFVTQVCYKKPNHQTFLMQKRVLLPTILTAKEITNTYQIFIGIILLAHDNITTLLFLPLSCI